METSSPGSVATVNARNVTNAKSLIAKSHPARRYDDSCYSPTSWVDNDHNSHDDDDVLSGVLLQVRHAYILPPATSAHVSQFTKRLESYGGVTTDDICRSAAPPVGCRCSLHQTVDDRDDQTQCRANVGNYRNTLEPRHDGILQETFKDVPDIKDSTSSGSPQDIYYNRRQNWFRDRSVSIPPYLRPIEEESDDEDQLQPLLVDCCEDTNNCRAVMLSAGARDVITPRPIGEHLECDVITNGRCAFDKDRTNTYDVTESPSSDCRQPINECIATGTDQCIGLCDEGGTYTTGDNYVTDTGVIGESSSRDSREPINGGDTCRTGGSNFTPDDVTGESQSRQHWRMIYIILASLIAFVACLTTMSLFCVILVVIVTSLIAHHLIQS